MGRWMTRDWQGPSARSMRLDLQPFTLVGATTNRRYEPLRDRFA